MKTIKTHPETNGGKAIKIAKKLIEENPKENRFLSMTILKGLGLEVDFLSMGNATFNEGTELKANLQSPFIEVKIN